MKIIKNVSRQGKWVFNDGDIPFQVRVVPAEEINTAKHLHKTMHEYFYVVRGCLEMSVDGDMFQFAADDIFVIEPGEPHHVAGHSDDLLLLLIMPPPIPGDKILIDD